MQQLSKDELRAIVASLFDNQNKDNITHFLVYAHTADHKTLWIDSSVDRTDSPGMLQAALSGSTVLYDLIASALREAGHLPSWLQPKEEEQ